MLELTLRRRWLTDKATEGQVEFDGRWVCWSIERPARGLDAVMPLAEILRVKVPKQTAMPVGRFRLELYDSPTHGPATLQFVAVPGFEHCQFHTANEAEQLEGCVGVGLDNASPDDDWVGQSVDALKRLRGLIVPRMKLGEEAWCRIVETPEIDTRTKTTKGALT